MLAFRNLLQPSLLRGAAPAAAAALASLRGAALGAPASSADATPAAAPGGGLLPLRQHLQAAGLRTGGAALASLQVKVPPLGESITDGSVAAILKAPGDRVEEDEVIIQVETDKVTIDVRSPRAGTVEAILVKEEENVGVGHVIACIAEGAGAAAMGAPAAAAAAAPEPAAAAQQQAASGSGRQPSIRFPPRRTPEGAVISLLAREAQAAALQSMGGGGGGGAAAAAAGLSSSGAPPEPSAPAPPPQPMAATPAPFQSLVWQPQAGAGGAPVPRREMSDREMELIMLGGAEP